MTESLFRHDKRQSRKAALKEVSLQTTAERRQRRCGCYVMWQTVPNMSCGDWESSVANGLTVAYDKLPVMVTMLNEVDVGR